MNDFFSSSHCISQAHCKTCRALTERGRAFRRSISDHFKIDDPDFECPHGLPWVEKEERAQVRPLPVCRHMQLTGERVKVSCCGSDEKTECNNADCVAERLLNDHPPYSVRSKCTKAHCAFFEAKED